MKGTFEKLAYLFAGTPNGTLACLLAHKNEKFARFGQVGTETRLHVNRTSTQAC